MSEKDNLIGKINLILMNTPEGITDLEKIRYYYIKLGRMFCYDFNVITDPEIISNEIDYDNIGKYQTCKQISDIFNTILSDVNETAQAKIIVRRLNEEVENRYEHVANEIEFTDSKNGIKYKLLLDLTLDLFRIQSDMKTTQFAFTTDKSGSYDIISLKECEDMDKKLGFLKFQNYKDDEILKIKEDLSKVDYSLKDKITYIWSKLGMLFAGPHEAKMYFENLIRTILPGVGFKNYNLYFKDVNNTEFSNLYIFDDNLILLFDNKTGIIFTTPENLKAMYSSGWKTSSKSLYDILGIDPYNEKIK